MSDKSIPGYSHPDCYARAISGCSTSITGEHYVSEGVLLAITGGARGLYVQNLAFQKEVNVPKEFGIRALQSNILCGHHNSSLSPLDTVAGQVVSAMDVINEMPATHGDTTPTGFRVGHQQFNGNQFELWMLKVLCGFAAAGAIKLDEGVPWRVDSIPPEYLRILFGWDSFAEHQGLYLLPLRDGEVIWSGPEYLQFALLRAQDGMICGLRMWLYGLPFLLNLTAVSPTLVPEWSEAKYRPEGIVFSRGKHQHLRFSWQGGHRSDPLVIDHVPGSDHISSRPEK